MPTSSDISIDVPASKPVAPQRVTYTDALRVSGAFAVIFIHVSGDGASAIDTLSRGSWWYCMALESITRWAVPIFVMVSGLLLLDPSKVETPGQFYEKRLKRLAAPFVFWSIFYLAWRWFYEGERFTFLSAVGQFIDGSGYYHLWFLTMLAGLYVATPALRILVRGTTPRQLWIITLTIIAMGAADAVVRANQGTDFTFVFKFCPFVGLFLLGHCLRNVPRSKKMIAAGIAAWVVGAVLSAVSTYFLVYHCKTGEWQVDDRLFLMEDEFSPSTLLMTYGVFTFFAAINENSAQPHVGKVISLLSAASLGIYLIHPLILSILNANGIDYEWHGVVTGTLVSIAVAAVGATTLSMIIGAGAGFEKCRLASRRAIH